MGEAVPDWTSLLARDGELDLAAIVHGGYVVDSSDRFFGEPRNMLMPYAAANTGDGWETKRRRTAGHDWAVIRLGIRGVVSRVEIDTAHFRGNYPDSASIDTAVVEEAGGGVSADVSTKAVADWKTVVRQTALQPDHLHTLSCGSPSTAFGNITWVAESSRPPTTSARAAIRRRTRSCSIGWPAN